MAAVGRTTHEVGGLLVQDKVSGAEDCASRFVCTVTYSVDLGRSSLVFQEVGHLRSVIAVVNPSSADSPVHGFGRS